MAKKIMRTIKDVSDEITKESLSTQPLLTNDYTYGNIDDLTEQLRETPEMGEDDCVVKSQKSLQSMENAIAENLHRKPKDQTDANIKDNSCMCK